MDVPVNYLVVLFAGIVSMVIGFLWYGPVFGKKWIALMHFTPQDMEQAKAKSMVKYYILAFVGSLLTNYVLSHLITFASGFRQMSGISVGLSTAFWVWLGISLPMLLSTVLWEGRSWKLFLLNLGYYLTSFLVSGAILASWM